MLLTTINELQIFLVKNWGGISDEDFQKIIGEAFEVQVFFRRETAAAEIEYLKKWINQYEHTNFYGGPIESDFNIKTLFNINQTNIKNLLFK